MRYDLIVMKFGGTSVENQERLLSVAKIIKKEVSLGKKVIAVVSAQGDTTDNLLALSKKITNTPNLRELDVLLSTGEQISIALLAMTLESIGVKAISLTGWQAGIKTCGNYSNARILDIFTDRIENELKNHDAIIIAGFQGINENDDITTMGRGGSDTTAVAIAAAINAKECLIYTDVDGVYTADPRIVKNAKKIKEVSYDYMIKMADMGAQVLNKRSVRLAKKYGVEISVLSSILKNQGTKVREVDLNAKPVTSLTVEKDLFLLKFKSKDFDFVSEKIKKNKINVSDIFFKGPFCSILLNQTHLRQIQELFVDFKDYETELNLSKISLICTNQDIIFDIFSKVKKASENIPIKYANVCEYISIILESKFNSYLANKMHDLVCC
ncbi:MAG: aspartate kinase [Clostridia bacterium]|nr:aspartate kinase [Clostridia bacterium]